MIVEFIGCSGSGKTTLIDRLKGRIGADGPLVSATDLVLDRPGRRWITHPTARNLVADVTVLPSFLRGPARDRDFMRFASERIRRHAPSAFAKANYLREVLRDVGKHELAERSSSGRTVLVDEGAVLTAYHLFVYSRAPFDRTDLERFARLVPMPDRIVYVTAPLEVLVDRAMRRPDRRRELASGRRDEVEASISRAVAVFDGLVATPQIGPRTLTVDNADGSPAERDDVIARIAAFIDDGVSRTDEWPASPRTPGS